MNHESGLAVLETIDSVTRWNVYYRLRELEVSCQIKYNKPLSVQINTITEVLQFRSVLRHMTASRRECLDWLEKCWNQS